MKKSAHPPVEAKQRFTADDVEIGRLIGSGKQGQVFLAKFKKSTRKCVVKKMSLWGVSPKEKEKMLREAEILEEAWRHPNIVRYLGTYEEENALCIVLEACQGGTLHDTLHGSDGPKAVITKEPLPEEIIMHWLVQLLLALKHLHELHIMHRDLKPANVLLSKNMRVIKLGDFGIAKQLDDTCDLAQTVVGTPYYMPPELLNGEPYTYAADMWSLGCVAYEMAAQRRAFTSGSLPFLVMQITRCNYPALPSYYSRPFTQLVDSMLRSNPQERPTAAALLLLPFVRKHSAVLLGESMPCAGPTLPRPRSALSGKGVERRSAADGASTASAPTEGKVKKKKKLKKKKKKAPNDGTAPTAIPGSKPRKASGRRPADKPGTLKRSCSAPQPAVVPGVGGALEVAMCQALKKSGPSTFKKELKKWEKTRQAPDERKVLAEARYAARQQELRNSRRQVRDNDERVKRHREDVMQQFHQQIKEKAEEGVREAERGFIAAVLMDGEADTASGTAGFHPRPRLDRTAPGAEPRCFSSVPLGEGDFDGAVPGDCGDDDEDEMWSPRSASTTQSQLHASRFATAHAAAGAARKLMEPEVQIQATQWMRHDDATEGGDAGIWAPDDARGGDSLLSTLSESLLDTFDDSNARFDLLLEACGGSEVRGVGPGFLAGRREDSLGELAAERSLCRHVDNVLQELVESTCAEADFLHRTSRQLRSRQAAARGPGLPHHARPEALEGSAVIALPFEFQNPRGSCAGPLPRANSSWAEESHKTTAGGLQTPRSGTWRTLVEEEISRPQTALNAPTAGTTAPVRGAAGPTRPATAPQLASPPPRPARVPGIRVCSGPDGPVQAEQLVLHDGRPGSPPELCNARVQEVMLMPEAGRRASSLEDPLLAPSASESEEEREEREAGGQPRGEGSSRGASSPTSASAQHPRRLQSSPPRRVSSTRQQPQVSAEAGEVAAGGSQRPRHRQLSARSKSSLRLAEALSAAVGDAEEDQEEVLEVQVPQEWQLAWDDMEQQWAESTANSTRIELAHGLNTEGRDNDGEDEEEDEEQDMKDALRRWFSESPRHSGSHRDHKHDDPHVDSGEGCSRCLTEKSESSSAEEVSDEELDFLEEEDEEGEDDEEEERARREEERQAAGPSEEAADIAPEEGDDDDSSLSLDLGAGREVVFSDDSLEG
ncbi:hypothetical protein CYMTET_28260 [Cymbomonas tetramitiformis]|uniref:non-specific serine/threonine protein kinase n=1 Tax=Cymbomonas tetramitiformis TaxID=36881 RepID=A0AAE0FNC4_9CHLO|nr:hypothetical protein CYMTET_28260 [Cymbomonas tetramitiformis]